MNADAAWQNTVRETLEGGTRDDGPRPCVYAPSPMFIFRSTPLVQARKTAWRNALLEFEWLLYGEGRVERLDPRVSHWWDRWAREGDVVPGVALPDPEEVVERLRTTPHSRRNVMTTLASGPCPVPRNDFVLQTVAVRGELELFVYQRTADLGRGIAHNWVQHWAFGQWLATRTGMPFACLRWCGGVLHAYDAHAEVLRRAAAVDCGCLRTPTLTHKPSGNKFRAADFGLLGTYSPVVCDPLEYV